MANEVCIEDHGQQPIRKLTMKARPKPLDTSKDQYRTLLAKPLSESAQNEDRIVLFRFLKRKAKKEGYPSLQRFWCYVQRAFDPHLGNGYGKRMSTLEKDIVLWYLKEEGVSVDTMLLASDEIGQSYRRVYR